MAEEDEIDILGDFSLDNLLSKNEGTMFDNAALVSQNSDLLKCDYTIHPQWLLDKPSTNPALWYNTSDLSSDLQSQSDLDISTELPISTENSITDESGWTEKEKNLLNTGIEIFGKSNVRLSQFIGSRTPAEVKYFLKNFHSDVHISNEIIFDNSVQETVVHSLAIDSVMGSNEVIDDSEIPASIEEVIATVSTAKPTVHVSNRKTKSNRTAGSNLGYEINYRDIPSGHSLLKSNFYKYADQTAQKVNKQKPTKITNDKIAKENVKSKKVVKFKFKTKLKVNKTVKNNLKRRRRSTKSETESSAKSEASDIEIVTGRGLSVPVCDGEEVIKIRKENTTSDSDVEIDIEDSDDNVQENGPRKNVECTKTIDEIKKADMIAEEVRNVTDENKNVSDVKKTAKTVLATKKVPELSELESGVMEELMSMEFPKSEYVIEEDKITELEKFIHYEFFEGRSTKTPTRYLKIRNHILTVWKNTKPVYVTKTSIRQGLKQCGDVNCIGRIHQFLEQMGAINFNCVQTSYTRPIYELFLANIASAKEKVSKEDENITQQKLDLSCRPRNKKKYINDGEGGCTLTHDERGEIINTTVINEEPIQRSRTYLKKPIIRLIYCRPFNNDHTQNFVVKLNLSVLLLMDLHAHNSLSEVMGLVGGHWDYRTKTLSITRYEPCKNIAPSSTHCDMCPVSQAKATDILHSEDLDVLGWFHSHPTFAPEPSQQDIETQLSVQQWIGNDKPCIGIILSPFNSHGALIASPYRCMIVDKKEHFEDQYVPYKFKVDVISSNLNVDNLLNGAWRIINSEYVGVRENKVDFCKPYFQDNSLSYLDKFISSIRMHLAKCTDVNKMSCDAVIQGLSEICSNNL